MREFAAAEVQQLQTLLESDAGYAERVTGCPPGPSDALSLLLGRPPGLTEKDKLVLGGWQDGELVSVVDVLRHWPEPAVAHIGLLFVSGHRRQRGLGRESFAQLARRAADWPGIRSWRAGILRSNAQVTGFWLGLGFIPTGEVKPYRYAHLETEVAIYGRRFP